jgi:lambda family phage tail tape measure protein
MSENLAVALSIQDRQALQSLKNVQTQVKSTTDAFRGLGTAIAALATGAFVTSTLQMATAMTNLSRSTGIALEAVTGFGQAFTASGGSIDRAADGISDLVKNVGDAARGSKELQNAFALAGVSLDDLGRLSEQDILRKTIAGLAAMPDSARRTSTAMQILGESVKGVDLQQLNRELDGFIQRAGPNAAAISAAAEAQRNFATASQNVQIELLAALKPISELAASITVASGAIKAFIATALDIAAVAASFFLITKAFALVRGAGSLLTGVFADISKAVGGLRITFGSLATQVRKVIETGKVTAETYTGLGKRFNALKTEIPLLGSALALLGAGAAVAYRAVMRLFGADKEEGNYTRGKAQLEDYQARTKAADDLKNRIVIVNAEEKKAVNDSIRAMQAANSETLKRINLQTSLLRANEETRFAVDTTAEAEQTYLKAIEPLLAKIQGIRDQGNKASATDIALLPTLEAGIARISKEYEKQVPAVQAAIAARIQEMQVAKEFEIVSARLTKQAEDRAAVETSVRDIILNGQQKINEAYDQAAQQSLPGVYSQLRQIADEENRIAEAARRRVAEQMGDDTTGLAQAISEINAATEIIIQRRQEAVFAISEDQRSFVTGWQQAFAEYATAATNSAQQARTVFQTVSQGIENSILSFVRTGKLSVKDLFRSIVETILRSQVQQLIARSFGALGGGGGGLLSSLFAGFFANGGRIPSGQFGVVGERGPEFVAGPATVTPMTAGGGGATMVTYNIQATDAASFQQLIARDPEFLFAVTEQGRRRLPNNRR